MRFHSLRSLIANVLHSAAKMANSGGGKIDNKPSRTRALVLESLETRELLSVSAAEFAAIQSLYSDLNIPDSCAIIEITASQLSQTNLEASLAAAQSVDNGLVIVRTTNSANTIIVTSELNVPAGVTLVSYGAKDLTLNAEQNSRVMTTGANVKLGGLVITGGMDKGVWDTSNNYYATYTAKGGGIYANGALTLDQCSVVANGAVADARTYQQNVKSYAYGGGIYSASGSLTIYDSSINGNQVYAEGGIGSEGVEGWDTTSYAEAYAYGGGVYASTVTIVNGELSNNEAKALGGTCSATKVSSGGDYLSLQNHAPFAHSSAQSYGGGIYAGNLIIADGVVSHNAAVSSGGNATAHSISRYAWSPGQSHAEASSYGGGIYSSSLTTTNSLIHDNGAFATGGSAYGDANSSWACSYPVSSAETLGGGAYVGSSVVSLNTSITNNKVESRGGSSRALDRNNFKYSTYSKADATAKGGGLWHGGNYSTTSTITNNTVSGNSASAIAGSSQVRFESYVDDGESGSTASSQAEAQGGGILGGVVTIYNSVIVNNEIEAAGGPTVTSHEQIKGLATATSNGSDVWKRYSDAFPSAYSTLSTCVEWKNGAQDNYQYANQTIFGAPVDGYYPLAANSYAKDKGNAQYWQDGLQYDDNGVLDLGAYDTRVHAVKLDTPTYKSSSSTASSITVAWNPVTNASGYVVEYRNATDTSYTVMPTTTATTLTIPDLAADTTYKLRVYAVGDGVNYSNSDYSSVKEVKTPAPTPTPLTAPTITTTTSTDASITVKWDAVANASGYVVAYRKSTDADWTVLAPTTATSQTISSLAANTTYNVKVFAKGDGTTWSDSDDSAVVSVKTQPKDLTPLDAPTWKSSSPTSSSITVVWNAVANASGYVVEYKGPTDTTFTAMPETTATTLTISNLEPETTYKFHVLAVGDGTSYSDSVFSAVKAVKTKAGTRRLTAPAITTTTSTISSITVKWDAVANASGYVVAYKKSTESDSSWTVLAQTTATSRTISSLAANTTYNVKVFAKGDGTTWSDSDDSAIVSVKTQPKDLTPLDAPTWKSSSPTSNSITVVWNAVANASGYVVEYKSLTDADYTAAPTTNDTTIVIPNLVPDTTYKLRVYAVGDGVNYSDSVYSSVKPVKTKEAVDPITLDAPTWKASSSTASSVTVAWNAVANASRYVVEYKSSTDAGYTTMSATTATTRTITNLDPSTTYKIRVYAVGDGVNYADSVYSAVKAVKTKVETGVTVAAYDTVNRNVAASWPLVGGATSYRFLKYANGAWARSALITVENGAVTSGNATIANGRMTYTINMFNAGVEGQFRIVAVDQQGKTLDDQEFSYTNFGLELDHEAYNLAGDTLTATTTPATNAQYQWYVSNNRGTTWTAIPGATSASLTLSAADASNLSWRRLVATAGGRQSVAYARPALVEAPSAFTVQVDAQNQLVMNFVGVNGAESYQVEYFLADAEYPVWINLTNVSYASAISNGVVAVTATHANGANYAQYDLRVRALTSDGWSEWRYASPESVDPITLAAPTWKSSSSTASSVTVAWNAVANASRYVVEYKSSTDAGYTSMTPTTSTTRTITNLDPSTTYKIRVYAVGDGVNYADSVYSAVKAVKTRTAGTASDPTITVASYNSSTRQAVLTWSAISGATTYKLQISKDGGATWTNYKTGLTTTSATVNGLYVGKSYGFRVYGVSSSGTTTTGYYETTFSPTNGSGSLIDDVFAEFFEEEFFEV